MEVNMKTSVKFIFCFVVILIGLYAASAAAPASRPVHTYSIVCYDPATGQFGAAVQSHYFKVADVIWAEAGVGAVATQSFVEFSYGPLGLAMMKNGKTAEQALQGLLASDPEQDVRQVAMIDKDGHVAAHTGENCIYAAGHHIGVNYSAQANLMENPTVWDAMGYAFENTEGDLAEKMMAALEAAQAEGGDIRGMQSAAILVVSGENTGQPWNDRLFDLRVDDSPEPLKELRRLINIQRAYDHMDKGDIYITENKLDLAKAEYEKAAELSPDNPEILYWYAVTLVSAGEVEQSLPLFAKTFKADERWRTLIPRLVKAKLLPVDEDVIKKIMEQ